jgi:hypothetical protein
LNSHIGKGFKRYVNGNQELGVLARIQGARLGLGCGPGYKSQVSLQELKKDGLALGFGLDFWLPDSLAC